MILPALTPPSQADALPRLWLTRLEAPLPPGAAAWLDEAERGRLERTGHAGMRRARLVAWSLRRWALSQARPDVAPEEWRFVPGPHGKPEAAPPFAALGLHHNLSHGGAFAAVLVADAPCGVDVEGPPDGLEAAEVVLGRRERAALWAHPRPAERFLQHWVFKEAALKLLGLGVLVAPDALELAIAPDGSSATLLDQARADLRLPPSARLVGWLLPDGHRLAAALGSPAVLQPAWAHWHGEPPALG